MLSLLICLFDYLSFDVQATVIVLANILKNKRDMKCKSVKALICISIGTR